ncbi:glycosyltransferase [Mesorhizobium sp. M1403]|uniref:glycosyltransferase n=1 Tax=Mesorhizobium sp. M1403 TaxID=2957097 RepID=UPI003336D845
MADNSGGQPRVTEIIVVFNGERYLREAVDSIVGQSFVDWELLVVDDGSTDQSSAIIRGYEQPLPGKVRLLAHHDNRNHGISASRNRGLAEARGAYVAFLDADVRRPAGSERGAAAARNAGIEAGSGDFLAFLDADDLYEPHMLETVLAAADANPEAAMIFGPTRWWYPDGESPDWIEPMDGLAGRLHQPPWLLSRLLLMQDGHVPCTCSVLVRRNAIELVAGFEERFRLYEDQALWVKLFLRYPAYVTPICLSRYRQHSGSVSADAAKRGLYDRTGLHPARAPFLDWLTEYVVKSGIDRERQNVSAAAILTLSWLTLHDSLKTDAW